MRIFQSCYLLLATIIMGCSSPSSEISYHNDVLPILTAYCVECHTSDPPGKGYSTNLLSMETYSTLKQGTKYGSVIVPGDAASSTLVRAVEGKVDARLQMPPHGKGPLPEADVAIIRDWVTQGAKNN